MVAALQRAITLNAALTEWRQPGKKSEIRGTGDLCEVCQCASYHCVRGTVACRHSQCGPH
jgi:hypothetical protein